MPGKTTTDKQYGLHMQAGKSRKSQQVALDLWVYAHKVILEFPRPGKPTDNAFIETFNSRFRQECLNEHWFLSIEDARVKIMGWREYNSHRPHSSLGYMTPEEFANLEAIFTC